MFLIDIYGLYFIWATLIFGLPKSEEYLPKGLPVQRFWNFESPAQVKKRKENEQVACEGNEQIKDTERKRLLFWRFAPVPEKFREQ